MPLCWDSVDFPLHIVYHNKLHLCWQAAVRSAIILFLDGAQGSKFFRKSMIANVGFRAFGPESVGLVFAQEGSRSGDYYVARETVMNKRLVVQIRYNQQSGRMLNVVFSFPYVFDVSPEYRLKMASFGMGFVFAGGKEFIGV